MNVLSTLIRDNLKRSVKFLAYEARRTKVLVSEGISKSSRASSPSLIPLQSLLSMHSFYALRLGEVHRIKQPGFMNAPSVLPLAIRFPAFQRGSGFRDRWALG